MIDSPGVIRFHLDEQMPRALARTLRLRGIDVTLPVEVGLDGAPDLEHIAYALREQRVIVTHDVDFLRHHGDSVPHAGIAFCHQGALALSQLIETLTLIHACLSPEEIRGRIEFLEPIARGA